MSGKQLIADYADLGVSCGYIGNIERWGDDRCFKVFTKVKSAMNSTGTLTINIGEAREFEGKEVPFDTPVVRATLDTFRDRVASGFYYVVPPQENPWAR